MTWPAYINEVTPRPSRAIFRFNFTPHVICHRNFRRSLETESFYLRPLTHPPHKSSQPLLTFHLVAHFIDINIWTWDYFSRNLRSLRLTVLASVGGPSMDPIGSDRIYAPTLRMVSIDGWRKYFAFHFHLLRVDLDSRFRSSPGHFY